MKGNEKQKKDQRRMKKKQQGELALQELWLPNLDVLTLEATEFSLGLCYSFQNSKYRPGVSYPSSDTSF